MRKYLYIILAASVMLSCVDEKMTVKDSIDDNVTVEYMSGQSVVKFSEMMAADLEEAVAAGSIQTKSSAANALFSELGVTSLERLFPHGGRYEARMRKAGLHRWYVVNYDKNVSFTKSSKGMLDLPGVEVVEPVVPIVRTDVVYNDPRFAEQWGMNNVETENGKFDINVTPVWANYTKGTPNVVVAVVDAGVDLQHEDLKFNLASKHYNAVKDSEGVNVIEADPHGTHVAGVVAATGNNGKGVVGVAGGDYAADQKGATIVSCQIFNPDGSTSTDGLAAARAMTWAANNGAVICQNSWGYHADVNADGKISADEKEVALKNVVKDYHKVAIDYFIQYAGCDEDGNQLPDSPMKGGLVVFAAGNDNLANGAPANYEPVIAVGSIASDGSKSSFSNYGDWVDISAPGTAVLSAVPGNEYELMDGTSMACPYVSGVAALVVSYCGKLGFTNEMLKERLLESANTELVPVSLGVGGLVDAMGAITYGDDKAPAKVTGLAGEVKSNFLNLSWKVPADEDGKPAYGYLVLYSKDADKLAAATATAYSEVDYKICVSEKAAGETVNFTLKAPEFNSEYHVKVIAYSYGANYAEASDAIALTTLENHAPVVENKFEGTAAINPYQRLVIPVTVSEEDGHEYEVVLLDAPANVEFMSPVNGSDYQIVVEGSKVESGTYTVKVKATDEYESSTELAITFTVYPNRAPEKLQDIEDMKFTEKSELEFDMTEYVKDEDGEQLQYTINVSDGKVAHAAVRGNTLYVTALNYGVATVEVVASDIRGEKVEFEFRVLLQDESKPVNVYPLQVKDYVNVATLDEANAEISIFNAAGKTMFTEKAEVSGFAPVRVDMSSYVPGVYSVTVSVDGKKYRQNVVKL